MQCGGILIALCLMLAVLDVAVGTELSLGSHTGGLPFWEGSPGGLCQCCLACLGVHTFLQRALCSLWGHSGMVACAATRAVFSPPAMAPQIVSPTSPTAAGPGNGLICVSVRLSTRSRGPPPAWMGGSSWLDLARALQQCFPGLERGTGFQEAPGLVQLLQGLEEKALGRVSMGPAEGLHSPWPHTADLAGSGNAAWSEHPAPTIWDAHDPPSRGAAVCWGLWQHMVPGELLWAAAPPAHQDPQEQGRSPSLDPPGHCWSWGALSRGVTGVHDDQPGGVGLTWSLAGVVWGGLSGLSNWAPARLARCPASTWHRQT